MNDEVEVSVELSAGGSWSSGPMTMQQLDQAMLPGLASADMEGADDFGFDD